MPADAAIVIPPNTPPARRWPPLLAAAAVGVVAYWPSIDHGFTYDDFGIIVRDPRLADPAFGLKLWVAPWWPQGSAAPASRPLTTFSLWAQVQAHGPTPWAFHLVNVLLYALLCAQVAAVAGRWVRRDAAAWAAGLLFAVHPLHVEAVANVVGRAEVLTAIFSLAAIDLYLRWRPRLSEPDSASRGAPLSEPDSASPGSTASLDGERSTGRRAAKDIATAASSGGRDPGLTESGSERGFTWMRSIAIGVAVLAAGLSKEHGYFTVAMLAAMELAARRAASASLFAKIPWRLGAVIAVVAAIAVGQRLAMTHIAETKPGVVSEMDNPMFFASPAERLVTPFKLIGKAASLVVAPVDQSPDYSPSMLMPTADVNDPQVIAGMLVGIAWAGLCVAAWVKRWRVLGPLLMLPVAWLIPSNTLLLIGTIFGERLLFMLTVVLALLAGHAAASLVDRPRLAGAVAIAACAGSLVQLAYTYFAWESYWMPPGEEAVTLLDPQLGVALGVLVAALAAVGFLWRRAMSDRPGGVALLVAVGAVGAAHGAATLCYSGVWKDGTTLMFTTVERHPLSGRFQGFQASEYLRLAAGNTDPVVSGPFLKAAENHARLALQYWPRQAEPYIVLAVVAHRNGEEALARRYTDYARYASPDGDFVDAIAQHIDAITPRDTLRARVTELEQQIAASPEAPPTAARRAAMLELARTLADLREHDKAVEWYEKLYDPSLTDPRLLNGYLDALLAARKGEKALEVYQQWARREPDNWAVITDAAIVSMAAGVDSDQSGRWLTRAIELAPRAPEPWAGLGQWHQIQGRIDQADRMYRKAISLSPPEDPKHAQYVFMLERLHRK